MQYSHQGRNTHKGCVSFHLYRGDKEHI